MPAAGARALAKQNGEQFYMTGVACKNGHVARRQTSSGNCTACIREYMRQPSALAYRQSWANANPEKRRVAAVGWYRRNAEPENKKRRERYATDPVFKRKRIEQRKRLKPYMAEYSRRYALENRERLAAIKRNYRARKKRAEGEHGPTDIERLLSEQRGMCAYCGVDCRHEYHVDHVIPLIRGGSNWPANLCIACPTCNTRKRGMDGEEFGAFLLAGAS